MTIFVILPQVPQPALDAKIKELFANNFFQLGPNQFLVSAEGTSQEVATKLGMLQDPPLTSAPVFAVGSYHGRAPTPVWDWVKAKLESKPSG